MWKDPPHQAGEPLLPAHRPGLGGSRSVPLASVQAPSSVHRAELGHSVRTLSMAPRENGRKGEGESLREPAAGLKSGLSPFPPYSLSQAAGGSPQTRAHVSLNALGTCHPSVQTVTRGPELAQRADWQRRRLTAQAACWPGEAELVANDE